jgi:hypothetical protein
VRIHVDPDFAPNPWSGSPSVLFRWGSATSTVLAPCAARIQGILRRSYATQTPRKEDCASNEFDPALHAGCWPCQIAIRLWLLKGRRWIRAWNFVCVCICGYQWSSSTMARDRGTREGTIGWDCVFTQHCTALALSKATEIVSEHP